MSKAYKCNCCQCFYDGHPSIGLGFNWFPEHHEDPLNYLDLCEFCKERILYDIKVAKEEMSEIMRNEVQGMDCNKQMMFDEFNVNMAKHKRSAGASPSSVERINKQIEITRETYRR